jgi:hypothetical protein
VVRYLVLRSWNGEVWCLRPASTRVQALRCIVLLLGRLLRLRGLVLKRGQALL